MLFHPLPNDKILNSSKFKAFADDKITMTQKFELGSVENIEGIRRKCWLPAFFLFPQCFLKFFYSQRC